MKNPALGLLIVLLTLFSCSSENSIPDGNALLSEMREAFGIPIPANFGVYALADCKGPGADFTTLVISDEKYTRFEQQSGSRHMIGVYSSDSSWMYNVPDQQLDAVSPTTATFLLGHELHMVAYYPELRYGDVEEVKDTTYYDDEVLMLKFTDLMGGPVAVYYEQVSLKPLGFSITNHLGRGPKHIDVLYDSWRTFDGVQAFTKARFIQGTDIYEYEFTDLRFEPLLEEVFLQNKVLISKE